ncbi:hypothetical protein Dda_1660 [Drechslerella dactyloides]|uniref:Uncharacterized protein n=1 Tax=Drechslerella dactyloides TaxID=74499 RepID=A0AAD6J6H1_DREDA|nr:hypothetical protein Dda_1660 [Drechslerella dactyloides]
MRLLWTGLSPSFTFLTILAAITVFHEGALARPAPDDDADLLDGGVVLGNRGAGEHSWCKTWEAALARRASSRSAATASPSPSPSSTTPTPSARPTFKANPPLSLQSARANPPLSFQTIRASTYITIQTATTVVPPNGTPQSGPSNIRNSMPMNAKRSKHSAGDTARSLLRRLLKRITGRDFDNSVKPPNPCRDPNPVFPDEGNPNEVKGCNQDIMNPDNSCPRKPQNTGDNNDVDCASFCEVRREYFYGREQRFHPAQEIFPYPDAPRISVTKGESVTITLGFSMDFAINLFILAFGNGMQMSKSWTWVNTRSFISPDWNTIYPYCGFYTFLPKMVRSCGTLTKWPRQTIASMGGVTQLCSYSMPPESFQNVCVEVPWLNPSGEPEGVLMIGNIYVVCVSRQFYRRGYELTLGCVIVKTVCGNEKTLAPPCSQDKKYLLPGVMDPAIAEFNMSDPQTVAFLAAQYGGPLADEVNNAGKPRTS